MELKIRKWESVSNHLVIVWPPDGVDETDFGQGQLYAVIIDEIDVILRIGVSQVDNSGWWIIVVVDWCGVDALSVEVVRVLEQVQRLARSSGCERSAAEVVKERMQAKSGAINFSYKCDYAA